MFFGRKKGQLLVGISYSTHSPPTDKMPEGNSCAYIEQLKLCIQQKQVNNAA